MQIHRAVRFFSDTIHQHGRQDLRWRSFAWERHTDSYRIGHHDAHRRDDRVSRLPPVASRRWRGGHFAATAGGGGASGPTLVEGEQDVIDLEPAAWFDASYSGAISESGGDVSKWTSREGNDIELVQATGSKQPAFTASNSDFNDKSTLSFDSSADQWIGIDARYIDTSGNVGTIFYVGKEQNGDSVARIVNWSTNGKSSIGTNFGSTALFAYQNLKGFGTAGDQLDPYMAVVSINGSSSYASMNEGTDATFTAHAAMTADTGNTAVGGYGGSGENSSTIAAEYIIFNTALNGTDVAKVETYLKNKYDGF